MNNIKIIKDETKTNMMGKAVAISAVVGTLFNVAIWGVGATSSVTATQRTIELNDKRSSNQIRSTRERKEYPTEFSLKSVLNGYEFVYIKGKDSRALKSVTVEGASQMANKRHVVSVINPRTIFKGSLPSNVDRYETEDDVERLLTPLQNYQKSIQVPVKIKGQLPEKPFV